MDNHSLDKIPLESPLNLFCYRMDKKLSGKTTYDYYDLVEKFNPIYLTNLFLKDCEFRFNAQLNILAERTASSGRKRLPPEFTI